MVDSDEQTRIMTVAGRLSLMSDERVHFLELVHGLDGRRYVVDAVGSTLGRRAPADIVLAGSEISRAHCRLAVRDGELWVRDLGSTNGTFVNGERLGGAVVLPVGGILQVGAQLVKHECRSRREYVESDELNRDLSTASAYVDALLPPKILEGPIRADWWFKPSAKLGGDAFGYAPLPDGRFAAYLMDVSGHGAAAAMHTVAVMNVLRQRALLMVEDGEFACLWAGDSRVYLARGGALTQLTRDHSLVQDLVDMGELDPADSASHPNGNIIMRAVGADPTLKLDGVRGQVLAGDAFLLATDGLTRLAGDAEMLQGLAAERLEASADRLLDACLERGAPDNVSFILLRAR